MIMELGRLTYDVAIDEVGDNKKVVNNRIAIQSGKGKNQKTFIDIVAWNNTAEIIAKYFKKGYEILIQGHLINKQKIKDNIEYDTVAILVDKVIFTNGNPKVLDIESDDIPDFLR